MSGTDPRILTFMGIRRAIGLLGFFFPVILLAGTFLFHDCQTIQDSISHYYYTASGDLFVGLLVAIALFLISYRGYDLIDNIITNGSGVCAIMVALLPTSRNEDLFCSIREVTVNPARETAHYVFAALFFILLAYLSYFRFTKSSPHPTERKLMRNRIFRVCGIIIVSAIILIPVVGHFNWIPNSTFWLEWTALAAFGLSWLTKGELIYGEK